MLFYCNHINDTLPFIHSSLFSLIPDRVQIEWIGWRRVDWGWNQTAIKRYTLQTARLFSFPSFVVFCLFLVRYCGIKQLFSAVLRYWDPPPPRSIPLVIIDALTHNSSNSIQSLFGFWLILMIKKSEVKFSCCTVAISIPWIKA